jgi:hypothetical protein
MSARPRSQDFFDSGRVSRQPTVLWPKTRQLPGTTCRKHCIFSPYDYRQGKKFWTAAGPDMVAGLTHGGFIATSNRKRTC